MDTAQSQALIRLSDAVGNARSLDEIYQAAISGLRDATGVERTSILLFDPDGVMRFKAWSGISEAYRVAVEGHTPWRPGDPPPDAIVVPDVTADPALAAYGDTFARERIRALAFIPIVSGRRVIGKFMLYRAEPIGFTPQDVSAALTIGYQIGFAVERTRREFEHAQQHQRLLFALDAAQMGTWEWNLGGGVRWSENLERIHGLPPGTFTGEFASYEREIHPEDRPHVLASLQRALSGAHTAHDVEYRIVAPDGTVRWVHDKGRVERDAAGAPIGMTGVCMDISERKRAEAEVAQALRLEAALRERLTLLTEGSQRLLMPLSAESVVQEVLALARVVVPADGYAVWRRHDAEWRVDASHGLSGTFSQEVLRPTGAQTLDGPVIAEDVSRLPLLADRQAAYAREGIRSIVVMPLAIRNERAGSIAFYYRTPHRPTEVELRVATALAQMASAAVSNAELHAQQQTLYREMQDANRLKDEFLATLSHELRTPLNVILGRIRMLGHGGVPAANGETIETIERNATVLARLVEDLLDISRITLGQVRLDPQPLDMPALVRSVAAGVEPAARARGVRLTIEADADLPRLIGDATRLQQVVWNLLSNAIKFTPAGGQVAVSLRRAATQLALAVSDTGEGIAPEFLPHVFDMFRQAEPTSNRRYGGLGLGLSIVRRLVELHGGTVTAVSEGVGRGASFEVQLPCTVPAIAPHVEAI